MMSESASRAILTRLERGTRKRRTKVIKSPKNGSIATRSPESGDKLASTSYLSALSYRSIFVAQIRPFTGVRYSRKNGSDISSLIAPPYDVLDEAGKKKLQAGHPQNIVTVDLPHLPAKTVGPDSAYAMANDTLQSWLAAGVLQKDHKPAIYPYAQYYTHGERTFHRRGVIALVKLSPFGEGHVFPHEKT